MLYAHYFASRRERHLILTTSIRPIVKDENGMDIGVRIDVAGKIDARRIADDNNAKCWNF